MQSGSKNPPWARSNANTNMAGINPQILDPSMGMGQQGMMPFQQSYNTNMMQNQGGMSMPMGGMNQMNQMSQGQMYNSNVVAYPTPRAMNSNMYSNSHSNHGQSNGEQRVFTGTVTKTHNDFGFVDHDVFYQTSVCTKGIIPKLNDRVLVEATYNANMPFKWNATRVQVLPKNSGNMQSNKHTPIKNNSYNAVPPPKNNKPPPRRDERPPRREEPARLPRKRSRSRSRSREKREVRPRRESPPRKRSQQSTPAPLSKNFVRVPRIPLEIKELDVATLTQRYIYMYVPSDFFNARIRWGEVFPPQNPFSLNNSCSFHIKNKEIDNPVPNDAVLEPPDADYRFSAKVMLLSMPTLESLYQKCGLTKGDDKGNSSSKSAMHPTRLIKFLVGYKEGGNDNFAIGGPWSPSLDGENPQSDPQVLVKTAIRTCKALTGIDLSACTQWYRMVEFNYWRESNSGRSRPECVVLFVVDANSAAPRDTWPQVTQLYADARDAALQSLRAAASPAAPGAPDDAADKSNIASDSSVNLNDSTITIEDNDGDDCDKSEATHYSKINFKTIKVDDLRRELKARNVSTKGLRPQLVSRLSKLLKTEEEKEKNSETVEVTDDEVEMKDVRSKESSEQAKSGDDKEQTKTKDTSGKEPSDNKEEKEEDKKEKDGDKEEAKKIDEKELANKEKLIKSRYELPSTPHIIVHPNRTAKGGKFNCHLASLSLLLDYRLTDNKEHSFELFVFAEIFNEMLMRDFGFYIYKTLYTLPSKVEEVEKAKEKSESRDEAKTDDQKDKNDEPKDKKDEPKDKKDDKDKKEELKDKKDDSKDKKEDSKDKKDDKKDDTKDKKDDLKDKKDDRDRKDDRRDDRREDRRDLRRKEQSTIDLPPDPYLLLSLVYFDTSRCGHVLRKDLQTLFLGLGLRLARSQLVPLLDRVCHKEIFHYTNLVQTIKDLSTGSTEALQDLSIAGSTLIPEVPEHITELEATIAAGNRNIIPVFDMDKTTAGFTSTPQVDDDGMVFYNGRVIRVGALTAALNRSEAARARLEAGAGEARGAARTARAAAAAAAAAARFASAKAQSETERLQRAKRRSDALEATVKIFHNTIKAIMTKADAVVNIKFEDEEVMEVNGTNKDDKEKNLEFSEFKDDDKIVVEPIELDEAEATPQAEAEKQDTKEDQENMEIEDKE